MATKYTTKQYKNSIQIMLKNLILIFQSLENNLLNLKYMEKREMESMEPFKYSLLQQSPLIALLFQL